MDKQLPELKVNMLGRFSITYGEQPITFKRNSATKAVKLLQILLHSSLVEDRGSTGIPRAQLLDDLFGREELANVGNNLRVTVFRLRKMLIEAGLPEYEYIVKEKGVFYWRSPMKVDLDVARFMELVREGEEEVDETRKMNLWEKACRLYKGELLPMQSGEDCPSSLHTDIPLNLPTLPALRPNHSGNSFLPSRCSGTGYLHFQTDKCPCTAPFPSERAKIRCSHSFRLDSFVSPHSSFIRI